MIIPDSKDLISRFIVVILFILIHSNLYGQVSISASGGNGTGTGGTVSYTVGQVVYTTNTGTTGSVSQGEQQPYEISVITAIGQAKGINLICSVYPNPASDFLTLKVENYEIENLSFQLFSLNGNLLESKKITGGETQIPMQSLTPSTYFLKVTYNGKELKTFKIIKN